MPQTVIPTTLTSLLYNYHSMQMKDIPIEIIKSIFYNKTNQYFGVKLMIHHFCERYKYNLGINRC